MSNREATIPANAHLFVKGSVIKTSLVKLMAFHEAPDALSKLTPFPLIIQIHRDERNSNTEGELEFTLWFGPIPVRWIARHEPGPTTTSFADRQIRGPLAYWRHEHIFAEVEGGVELTDRITIAHHSGLRGLITRLLFDGLLLRILFFYRHQRTKRAVME